MKDPGQESECDSAGTHKTESCIDDLPDEVIEFVLSLVPPYKDLHNCMQVCKRWRISVLNVVKLKRRQLFQALSQCRLQWQRYDRVGCGPVITQRNSHAATVHRNHMYVFGGCTNTMTSFNDLWRLELGTRNWERPRTSGNYPTPKACSTLVCHGDRLVLFGGWAFPCTFPFHQSHQLFNELHTYDIAATRWQSHARSGTSTAWPPPLAGHSVSVHGSRMVVFGGLQRPDDTFQRTTKSNELWQLDLDTMCWEQMRTTGPQPRERYGHSQVALDEHHALVAGGCGRPNDRYTDVWLLVMTGRVWTWRQLTVLDQQWAPLDTARHPMCHVGDHVVLLNPLPGQTRWKPSVQPPAQGPATPPPPGPVAASSSTSRRQSDLDVNVNGRRGELVFRTVSNISAVPIPRMAVRQRDSSGLVLTAFVTPRPSGPPPYRLDLLRRMQQGMREGRRASAPCYSNNAKQSREHARRPLGLYILDVSGATGVAGCVRWQEPAANSNGPEETLMYSLVYGRAELIMFGGLQQDYQAARFREEANNQPEQQLFMGHLDYTKVCTALHFISAPPDII